MTAEFSRRGVLKNSVLMSASAVACDSVCGQTGTTETVVETSQQSEDSCLTPAEEFYTVARGTPKPHSLKGKELVAAGMTRESWRLEIRVDDSVDPPVVKQKATAEKQLLIADGTAIDFEKLISLEQKSSVKLIKAIQCLNIPAPLGQGLWEGIALRDVLNLCGKTKNVRRIYYWGFHNNDPTQRFQSSLSYTQAVDHAPNDPPVFLAYKLNGKPISPLRGGPVRMIVPWAYGFKSIKWLQNIVLSNDPRANDTYSNQNNDPDSPIKTAAYLNKPNIKFEHGVPIPLSGIAISGLSDLKEVQYSIRRVEPNSPQLEYDHPEIQNGRWEDCELSPPPSNWKTILPKDVSPSGIFGFDRSTGKPTQWPMRYGMANWKVILKRLDRGSYEFRVRTIDRNGFAQPDPRPLAKSGRNAMPVHRFQVV